MTRRAWAPVILTAIVIAIVAMTSAVAMGIPGDPNSPYTTNTQCLYCHESALRMSQTGGGTTDVVDFNVGAVNKATACKKCHLTGLVGTHPFHNTSAYCGAFCHEEWGTSLPSAVPMYSDANGSFNNALSSSTSSDMLHIIHKNPRWPASDTVVGTTDKCISCHATASCSACHDDIANPVASPTHDIHGSSNIGNNPWTGIVGSGVVGDDMTQDSSTTSTLQCGTGACHDLQNASASLPVGREDFSHADLGAGANVVTVSGTWMTKVGSAYSAGRMSYSNYAGAYRQITFDGERFEIVSDRDPYRGIFQVYIDNMVTPTATVDCYSAQSRIQAVVYTSPKLTAGTHTVRVRATGTRNASSRASYVNVDSFRVYVNAPGSAAPFCGDCHAGLTELHDGSAGFDHQASQQAGTYSGFACTQCHNLLVKTEHSRANVNNNAAGCNICHTTYAPLTWTGTYTGTCSYGNCHISPRNMHHSIATGHTYSAVAAELPCRTCHTGDLGTAHSNQYTGNAWATSCLTCHGPTKFPASKDCTNAGCHVASGTTAMNAHSYAIANHTAAGTDAGVTGTGGKACNTCHVLEVNPEHVKATSRTSTNGAIECRTCHEQTYFPYGWTPKQCVSCHATGKAPVPHQGYSTRHNYAVLNPQNTTDCGGATCHDVTMADALHSSTLPGTGDCNSCHVNATTPVTQFLCTACHSGSPYHPQTAAHNGSAVAYPTNASCLSCHSAYSNVEAHTNGCAACHSNATLVDYLLNNYTSECVSCHAVGAGKLGTAYMPVDPAHYSSTLHAPTNTTQANDATYNATACGSCHYTELQPEHAATYSARTLDSSACVNCHTTAGSATAVANSWSAKNTTGACSACHGQGGIDAAHGGNFTTMHTATSTGCASSGAGCHPVDNIGQVGTPSTTANIHATCLRCHDRTATAPNVAYNPNNKTCGTGRTCHATGYSTTTFEHNTVTGTDAAKHTASGMTATVGSGANNQCQSCHSTTLKAAHTGTTANLGWSAPNCDDCHNKTTGVNAATVVKASWTLRTCDECHVTNGPGKHDRLNVTYHVGDDGANNCVSCHADSPDLALLHDATTTGCKAAGCHDTIDKDMTSAVKGCGDTTVGNCHYDKNDGNHGAATAHDFTTSSNYIEGTESGCTNSGSGCHGTEAAFSNYSNTYHPNSGCTEPGGVCHDSASKPTFTGDGADECVDCHTGGAFTEAPDTVALTDTYPGGHYNTTTHTATGMSGVMKDASGSAQATCSQCHAGVLYAQHTGVNSPTYGANLSCSDCHNDPAAPTGSNGLAQVVAGWSSDTCADCHSGTSTTPQHTTATITGVNGTGAAGCGATGANCHVSNDLHVLHKNTTSAQGGCNVTNCHNFGLQAAKPTITSCGTGGGVCHSTYTNTTHAHATDAAKHQPTNTTQATDNSFNATQCGACHDIRNSSSSLTLEHALSTSVKSGVPANSCQNCHNNSASNTAVTGNWATKDTTSACSTCHGQGALHTAHPSGLNSAAHTAASASCGASGAGCHPVNDLSQVGTPSTTANLHSTCLRCHDRTATAPNLAYNPANKTCGETRACHATAGQYSTTTLVHNGTAGAGLADGTDAAHHTADATYMSTALNSNLATNTCANCHSNLLKTAHTNTTTNLGSGNTAWGTGIAVCTTCHNNNSGTPVSAGATQVKGNWTNNRCNDCHGTYHNTYGNHTGTSTQGCASTSNFTGCHITWDLIDLHDGRSDGCRLAGCHDAADKGMQSAAKSCGSGGTCHNTYTNTSHGSVGSGDTTYHNTTSGMTADATSGNYTAMNNTCAACHDAQLITAHTANTASLNSANPAWSSPYCLNCHNTTTPDAAATVVKSNWVARTCAECHGSTIGTSYHVNYTTPKHTSAVGTVTTADSCGDAGCHNSLDVRAIHNTTKYSSCANTGCHDTKNAEKTASTIGCGTGTTAATKCHTDKTDTNHKPEHDITTAWTTAGKPESFAYHGQTYYIGEGIGCQGCHFTDLSKEHDVSVSLRTMTDAGAGSGCGICHSDKGGTVGEHANDAEVIAAITNGNSTIGNLKCTACHNDAAGGADTILRPHQTASSTGSKVRAQADPLIEFKEWGASGFTGVTNAVSGIVSGTSGGGHNAAGLLYPNTSGFGTVQGVAVTTWPLLGTYKTGWAATSQVLCSDCHYTTDAAGPQGAATPYLIFNGTAYQTTHLTTWLSGTTPYVLTSTTPPGLCGKCHLALNSGIHNKSAHKASLPCVGCHIRIPHGWKRPRLLRRTIDDAGTSTEAIDALPYSNPNFTPAVGYTQAIGVDSSAAPATGNCVTGGCGAHGGHTPYWP